MEIRGEEMEQTWWGRGCKEIEILKEGMKLVRKKRRKERWSKDSKQEGGKQVEEGRRKHNIGRRVSYRTIERVDDVK